MSRYAVVTWAQLELPGIDYGEPAPLSDRMEGGGSVTAGEASTSGAVVALEASGAGVGLEGGAGLVALEG